MFRTIGVILFALLVAVLAIQNAGPVVVHLLYWRFPGIPLALVILVSFLLGAAVLAGSSLGRRKKGHPAAPASSRTEDGQGGPQSEPPDRG